MRNQRGPRLSRGKERIGSDEQYRGIVDAATDGIAVVALDGKLLYFNPALALIVGYASNELEQKSAFDIIAPDDWNHVRKHLSLIFRNHETAFECREVRKDGSLVPVEVRGIPFRFDGRPAMLALVRDISDRKKTEMELQEANEKLRAVIAASPPAIIALDADRNVTMWSKSAERIFGWRADEVIGKPNPVVPDDEMDLYHTMVEKELRGELLPELELRCPRRDGSLIDVSISTAPVFGRKGVVIGVMGVIEDITERKIADDALARSEAKYRELVEDISDWVWEVKLDGTFTYASSAIERILGYKPEEVVGRNAFEFMVEEDRERCLAFFTEMIEKHGAYRSLLHRNRHKDGSIRYIETTGSPVFDENGYFIGYRGVDRDVTERVAAEEEIGKFYRATIAAFTAGKLDIVTPEEAEALAKPTDRAYRFVTPEEASAVRKQALQALEGYGLKGERLQSFIIAVGEAINNAVKHAGGGGVGVGTRDGAAWVSICDSGPGIEHLSLPRVVLEKGYSTKASLGLGYSIMLDAADRIALSTGPEGTRVVLEKRLGQAKPSPSPIDVLPETW